MYVVTQCDDAHEFIVDESESLFEITCSYYLFIDDSNYIKQNCITGYEIWWMPDEESPNCVPEFDPTGLHEEGQTILGITIDYERL